MNGIKTSILILGLAMIGANILGGEMSGENAKPTSKPEHNHVGGPSNCGHMEIWDHAMGMCMPYAMKGMPMTMLMVHGNLFGGGVFQEKPRGVNKAFSTSMVMADLGKSIGDSNYVNLDVMLTAEKWTLPKTGYPELLQIGEEDANHNPYIDAQHPHNSPIMGMTLSDTITLGKIFG